MYIVLVTECAVCIYNMPVYTTSAILSEKRKGMHSSAASGLQHTCYREYDHVVDHYTVFAPTVKGEAGTLYEYYRE